MENDILEQGQSKNNFMKRIVILISLLVSFCALQAQDTIYPYQTNGIFYVDTSFIHLENELSHSPHIGVGGYADHATGTWCSNDVFAIKHIGSQVRITGVAMPFLFRTEFIHTTPPEDWNHLYGILITIDSDDYAHPHVHLTSSYVLPDDPYDCYLALQNESVCGELDTVIGAYSFYFEEPIIVSGPFYIGCYVKNSHTRYGIGHESYYGISCQNYPEPSITYDSCILGYYLSNDDSTVRSQYLFAAAAGCFELMCPIFSVPDTDSFGCPEVEGFGFAGINAGTPTFVWDSAGEYGRIQLAYGPYDMPLDSLRIVETRGWYHELFDGTLSPDVYYQARVRARCHHRCPIHDTVMWTAWSDPVFFYTGDHMPDTTHHQDTTHHEEGITVPAETLPFTIMPNPARGGEALIVAIEQAVPLRDLTLAVHDAAGHEMLRMEVCERRFALPTHGLQAGVYAATLFSLQGSTTRRIVIEN